MRLKQVIISLLLLFVYSFGFAHSMMPHEHGFYAQNEPEFHDHEHHDHANDIEVNKSHIDHNDHCDEGLFDLILCVLNDFQHHNHDCEDEHLNFENSKRLTNTNVNNSASFTFSSFKKVALIHYFDCLKLPTVNRRFCINYISLSQTNSPLRGPPVKFI